MPNHPPSGMASSTRTIAQNSALTERSTLGAPAGTASSTPIDSNGQMTRAHISPIVLATVTVTLKIRSMVPTAGVSSVSSADSGRQRASCFFLSLDEARLDFLASPSTTRAASPAVSSE